MTDDTSTPLERETTGDTTTVEHLGREWTIPTKRHLGHLRFGRNEIRHGVSNFGLLMVEAFLSPAVAPSNQQKPDQFAELVELDPDEDEVDALGDKIARALGLDTSGNS